MKSNLKYICNCGREARGTKHGKVYGVDFSPSYRLLCNAKCGWLTGHEKDIKAFEDYLVNVKDESKIVKE